MHTHANLGPLLAEWGYYIVEDNTGATMRRAIARLGAWHYHEYLSGRSSVSGSFDINVWQRGRKCRFV